MVTPLFVYIITGIIILLALVCIFVIRYENTHFKVTCYELKCPKLKKKVTMAVLADLHDYCYGEDNERLMQAIDEIKPDLVVSAGDMITASCSDGRDAKTFEFLTRISEKHTFVYGCGNHEDKRLRRDSKERNEPIKRLGILDNECMDFDEYGIRFYGLNLEYDYFRKVILRKTDAAHIKALVGEPSDDHLNILMGHNPDQLDAYSDWGADLVLAGHIHGGMIGTPWRKGLISPMFKLFPIYDRGIYKKGNTTMVLSAGLGNHTVHVRMFNPAELIKLELIPE